MGRFQITGLVARAVEYKESDLILTVLSPEKGLLTVSARGARKHASVLAAATQVLCLSKMLLSEYQGRFTLADAEILETFQNLRGDLSSLSLGIYAADIAQTFAPEGDMFELLTATLNALNRKTRPLLLVKAAFEFRALYLSGFDPSRNPEALPLSGDLSKAAEFIKRAETKRLFSFTLGEQSLNEFLEFCEQSILSQLEREPASLKYFREVYAP